MENKYSSSAKIAQNTNNSNHALDSNESDNAVSFNDCEQAEDCAEIGQWNFGFSLGLGARTNPLIDGDNIPLLFLPTVSYYGEKFFINNLDIGYNIYQDQNWSVNFVTTPALDRVYFEKWDVGNFFIDLSSPTNSQGAGAGSLDPGNSDLEDRLAEASSFDLEQRDVSWMGGIEIFRETETGHLVQLSIVKDMIDVHNGTEARFAWSIPLIGRSWNTTVGFTWKDAKMSDYYYGLKENEITDDRAAYSADSSFNPFVRLSWFENTESDSRWRFSLEYQKFGKGIGDSPILDADSTLSIFVGKQYNF